MLTNQRKAKAVGYAVSSVVLVALGVTVASLFFAGSRAADPLLTTILSFVVGYATPLFVIRRFYSRWPFSRNALPGLPLGGVALAVCLSSVALVVLSIRSGVPYGQITQGLILGLVLVSLQMLLRPGDIDTRGTRR